MQRHRLDATSLAFGLVFAAAGSLLLAGHLDVLTHANWVVPVLLIVAAIAMFASASWSTWRRGERETPTPHDRAAPEDGEERLNHPAMS